MACPRESVGDCGLAPPQPHTKPVGVLQEFDPAGRQGIGDRFEWAYRDPVHSLATLGTLDGVGR